jgi:hypothetical protein
MICLTVHGKYDESAIRYYKPGRGFFTFNTTSSSGAKPAPVKVAVDSGA